MPVLGAGARDQRVELQALTDSVVPSGFPVETWELLTTVWAARVESRGQERFAADQLSAPVTVRWHIPYSADMDPALIEVSKRRRLVHNDRAYDITTAAQIGRRQGIELTTLGRVG